MHKVFNLVNRYIILATPLILFSLISSVYTAVSLINTKVANLIISIILFILMTSAFIAGWFNMIKTAVEYPEKEDVNSLMKEFLSGVGEYILPSLGAFSIFLLMSLSALFISYFYGFQAIVDSGISIDTLINSLRNAEAMKNLLASLTPEQMTKILHWNILNFSTLYLSYFLMFLYLPALFFKEKNPLKAFFISLKDLFSKNIVKNIGLFSFILIINIILSILANIANSNIILHFILTLINFYFTTCVAVGVFYYYYHNFIKLNLGQNIDIEI